MGDHNSIADNTPPREPLPSSIIAYIIEGTPADPDDVRQLSRNADSLALRMHFFETDESDLSLVPDPAAARRRLGKLAALAKHADHLGYGNNRTITDRRSKVGRSVSGPPKTPSDSGFEH